MMTCADLWALCNPSNPQGLWIIWEKSDIKLQQRRGEAAFLLPILHCEILLSEYPPGERCTFGLGRLSWYLLALCVVILNQVLQEVHSFLGLDLIYFDQVLQAEERSRVQLGWNSGHVKRVFGVKEITSKQHIYTIRGDSKKEQTVSEGFIKPLMYWWTICWSWARSAIPLMTRIHQRRSFLVCIISQDIWRLEPHIFRQRSHQTNKG